MKLPLQRGFDDSEGFYEHDLGDVVRASNVEELEASHAKLQERNALLERENAALRDACQKGLFALNWSVPEGGSACTMDVTNEQAALFHQDAIEALCGYSQEAPNYIHHDEVKELVEALEEVDRTLGAVFWTTNDGEVQEIGSPDDDDIPEYVSKAWRQVLTALAKWKEAQ